MTLLIVCIGMLAAAAETQPPRLGAHANVGENP